MKETTSENLKKSFAGEAQANRKYLAFSKKAEDEGLSQVAKFFRAAADSETVHALSHLRNIGDVKSTKENLEAAIAGEDYEFNSMYPSMINQADVDQETSAKMSFTYASAVEKEHSDIFKKALSSMKDFAEDDYYICQGCGHVHLNEAPEKCPVCGAPSSRFKKVD
ncbi:rubrerythrin [bacterium CG2_30_37_16]|nr:MAG: rubrerythrin [bacterium CG2_30_37_16]PIP30495.1 MAG: rubrerythrin [bacterium (Candidatus Howlettbacteria) CG23_combo_of_CG06-09_8_20_14_all_37_9]PIX99535.1 MAG: rubrerythrin [bacterium (Candidatus Howlettbacteria) CG_4_10_14_3_um_filter_37_10]PJB07258.1 MAG: rubrerythrin [bacterium (Candidatus Howlettbacteria) CG_4_9_14_3_um_filter_37_10]